MSAVNEALIRDVVSEVLGRLGRAPVSGPAPAAVPPPSAGASCKCHATPGSAVRGAFGVFSDAGQACEAAHEAYLQLQSKGVEARRKIVDIVKGMAEAKAEEWGRLELDESKIGRLDHKI